MALHNPPDKIQARVIKRRIRVFGEWCDSTAPDAGGQPKRAEGGSEWLDEGETHEH